MKAELIISHESALRYWRSLEYGPTPSSKPRSIPSPTPSPSKAQIEDALSCIPCLHEPLHILLFSDKQRPQRQEDAISHICSIKLPRSAFSIVAPGIAVCSPEYCAVQMVNQMTPQEWMLLCFELCGRYRLMPASDFDDRGFARRDNPLTTPSAIAAFLRNTPGLRGGRTASRLLKYISQGAESPKESQLALTLGLPYKYGGYSLGIPVMGKEIPLSTAESIIAGKSSFRLDLYWPLGRTCVEYDSKKYHSTIEKLNEDALRRNVLENRNIRVITVTPKQFCSTMKMDGIADHVRRSLKKRRNPPCSGYFDARQKLMMAIEHNHL